jgi:LysR family glycine cleavage system transcriptional activator
LHAAGFASGWPQWLERVGARHVLERTTPVIGDTMAVILALAMRDAGIALARSDFVETALAEGTLVAPFDSWMETDESFFVTRIAGRKARPEAELFWSWLVSQRRAET